MQEAPYAREPSAPFLESRYRLAAVAAGLLLALALLTRVALLVMQHVPSRNGVAATLRALAVGEAFDLVAVLWAIAPFFLYLTVVPERWFRHRVHRALVHVAFGLLTFGALFVAIAELFFFDEFNGRFNFVAVDYLMFPTEVVDNIWESYPTGLILTLIAAAAVGVVLLLRKPLREAWRRPVSLGQRGVATLLFALVLAALTWGVSPGLAHISEDRALNEIATNGYYSFWMALLGSDAPYEGLYASAPPQAVFPRLHELLREPATVPASFVPETTQRHIQALGPRRPMNVVVVLEESLGSEFIGALHPRTTPPATLTPQFDALSREGTLLTHAFSTGNRTIRAIEATTSSLPPLPGISIVRRKQSENLFTLPGLLRQHGYQTLWCYGGRALFDGMGKYLSNNGIDRIVEQSDYPDGTFMTAWGAADEAIFDRALTEMDAMHATGKPFYTLVLTVSNHRPYAYPEGRLAWDKSLKRRENAVRYADWALGRFLRQAHDHAFFDNTLFVLMGDHGARVYGAAEIPLGSYEVPILFYAPKVIPAGRLDTLASSLDVPPTVLGVLGLDYESKFFGHDVLHVDPSAGRALMTHNNEIALMRGSRIAVLGLHQSAHLFQVEPDEQFTPLTAPDAAGRQLIADAIAYYSAADREYRTGAYGLSTRPPSTRLADRRSGG
jgi:phosphoglycerol transferase MdoB-like AlkP superfamily enzyme